MILELKNWSLKLDHPRRIQTYERARMPRQPFHPDFHLSQIEVGHFDVSYLHSDPLGGVACRLGPLAPYCRKLFCPREQFREDIGGWDSNGTVAISEEGSYYLLHRMTLLIYHQALSCADSCRWETRHLLLMECTE